MCEICEDDISDSVHGEHVVFCHDDSALTCDINAAYEAGAYYWAARLLTGATECGATEGSVARARARHGNEAYEALVEESRKLLCVHKHETCLHCNSVAWDIDENWIDEPDASCPECGERYGRWYAIPYTRIGEDDVGDTGVALLFARNREIAQGGEHEFGSFDAHVSDVSEDLWGSHVTENYDTGSAEHSDAGYVYLTRSCDCGDDDCASEDGDNHESLTIAIAWNATSDFREFNTLDEAKEYAAKEHRVDSPVVIGTEE